VLVADDSVLVALADLMLGGTGTVPTRPVHRVEAAVLRRHLTTALSPLVEPLAEHGVTGIALAEPPIDEVVTYLGGTEVIAVRLRIAISGETLAGAMILAVPSRLLLGGAEHEPTGSRSTMAALAEVPLDVTVQFPATTFSAYEMTGLERGDVLRLEAGDPFVVGQIEGRQLLTGSLGRSGRRRAIVVQSVTGG
jgi:flagellar motor switch protein FliM